jgi:hypothetical protein
LGSRDACTQFEPDAGYSITETRHFLHALISVFHDSFQKQGHHIDVGVHEKLLHSSNNPMPLTGASGVNVYTPGRDSPKPFAGSLLFARTNPTAAKM